MAKNNAYEIITDRILELLEQGTVPWQRPWTGGGLARNLVSKRPYRGINCFLLNISGYSSPYWATLNQINKLGGRVIKGQKSMPVIFWKWLEVEDQETGERVEKPFLRYYRVFNLEQTQGIEAPESEKPEQIEFNPIRRCEELVTGMPNPPRIVHERQSAFYRPKSDLVNMPRPETFVSAEEHYSTLFHELAHASGHESRLNRPSLTEMAPFGSTNYSREELIAEMTAAMLCGVTGIENKTIDNSAAYVQGWLKKLKNDKRLVVLAAAQAQKAADYIQGNQVQEAQGKRAA